MSPGGDCSVWTVLYCQEDPKDSAQDFKAPSSQTACIISGAMSPVKPSRVYASSMAIERSLRGSRML